MAFGLQVIVSGGTISLSNGTPYALLGATGMGAAGIRRVTARGPAQDGDTDMGYRLASRDIELTIGFKATTDALLDTSRDTLTETFKPLSASPIRLRYTRDDGVIRQVDCYTVDKVVIDLVKEVRPAHYHRATVKLRAAEPAWYNPTPGTASVTGTASITANWWLAGGAIGSAQVMMHGGTPSQGEAWSYAGTIGVAPGSLSDYTLAIRAGKESTSITDHYAYYVDNNGTAPQPEADFTLRASELGTASTTYSADGGDIAPYGVPLGENFMAAGTSNYFIRYVPDTYGGGAYTEYYRDGELYLNVHITAYGYIAPIAGTARRWRSNATNSASSRWTAAIPLYALYAPRLTTAQIAALNLYMGGLNIGTVAQVLSVPYEGDLPEFPVISVRGPISAPRITNTVTGDTLNFGTVTIGAGTTYVIDTRYGLKTITAGTVNKRGELAKESDLDTWRLVPDPVAQGGINTIAVYGSATGTATQISVVYYNRYTSY